MKGVAVLDLTAARRVLRALPAGALHVGAGLVVLGLSTYGFLLISARALTPSGFAGLSVLYVLVYTVAPGVFLPFEQEIGRALADRRARGLGSGPLLRRALAVGAVSVLALLILVAAASPALTQHLFDHSWLMSISLLVSVIGVGGAYLTRGIFAGNGQFGAYGAQMAIEGALRFTACVVLAIAGVHVAGGYGMLFGGAFILAVLLTVRRLPRTDEPGPVASLAELTGALGWLVVGALLAQVLVNVGPVAVKLLAGPDQKAAAGQLLAGLVLARLPLFLFAAIQAALLPRLAAQIADRQVAQFRAGLRRLVLTLTVLSGLMTLVLAAAGPQIMHLMFGARFHLGRVDLVLLSGATGLFMMANVLANGLLALQRFGLAAAGWAVGVITLFAVLAVPASLFVRVEASFLAATVVSVLACLGLLRVALRSADHTAPHARPIVDVVTGL